MPRFVWKWNYDYTYIWNFFGNKTLIKIMSWKALILKIYTGIWKAYGRILILIKSLGYVCEAPQFNILLCMHERVFNKINNGKQKSAVYKYMCMFVHTHIYNSMRNIKTNICSIYFSFTSRPFSSNFLKILSKIHNLILWR